MKNILDKFRANQNTHFIFRTFFSKVVSFRDKVEKYFTAGQAIENNTGPAY
jgi:hypothetical protein